jgi:hypothetical protein
MQQNLMPWALAIEGGLGLAAVGLGWLVGYPPADAVPQWTAADFAAGALSAIPMLAGLIVLVRVPWRPFVELLRVIDESVAPLFRGVRLGEMAVIAGLAGLGEEMLFRGVIQRALAGWIGGPSGLWIALGVTAVLFGLGHAITRMYFAIAALMGLYLGGLLLATNNLLVPITAHAVYDFLALVYLVRIRTPVEPKE